MDAVSVATTSLPSLIENGRMNNICNSKQIWNSDTCKCDCNEDFAGIINCTKGYMWNPSTCACECDMWCKPGQYLDHKNCVCKNK